MNTKILCALLSHNKPRLVKDAIRSIEDQTLTDWTCIIHDSGILYDAGAFSRLDPRFKVWRSVETQDIKKPGVCMFSWSLNYILNSYLPDFDLFCFCCDDDYYLPTAFETFYKTHKLTGAEAMYSGQYVAVLTKEGFTEKVAVRKAKRPAGIYCNGIRPQFKIDGMQFCCTKSVLDTYSKNYGTEFFDENYIKSADGKFLERVGSFTTIQPIPEILSVHRRTNESAYVGLASSKLGWWLRVLKSKFEYSPREAVIRLG